jgi:hypothetical protein
MGDEKTIYRSIKKQVVPAVGPDGIDFELLIEKGREIHLTKGGSSGAFFELEGSRFYLFRNEYETVYLYPECAVVASVSEAEKVCTQKHPIVR